MSKTTEGFSLQGCLYVQRMLTHVLIGIRSAKKYHIGSIISNKVGSVILSQTPQALVRLNSISTVE